MSKGDERKGPEKDTKQIGAIINQIEDGGVAVLYVGKDAKTKVDVPASLLPAGASDGDHLTITITIDRPARAAAEERIRQLQDELKQQSGTEGKQDFKL